jgi:hypothetical protein
MELENSWMAFPNPKAAKFAVWLFSDPKVVFVTIVPSI